MVGYREERVNGLFDWIPKKENKNRFHRHVIITTRAYDI